MQAGAQQAKAEQHGKVTTSGHFRPLIPYCVPTDKAQPRDEQPQPGHRQRRRRGQRYLGCDEGDRPKKNGDQQAQPGAQWHQRLSRPALFDIGRTTADSSRAKRFVDEEMAMADELKRQLDLRLMRRFWPSNCVMALSTPQISFFSIQFSCRKK